MVHPHVQSREAIYTIEEICDDQSIVVRDGDTILTLPDSMLPDTDLWFGHPVRVCIQNDVITTVQKLRDNLVPDHMASSQPMRTWG